MKFITHLGQYLLLVRWVFTKPDKGSMFRKQLMENLYNLGVQSVPLVFIISIFMGAVLTIQTASNVDSGMIPDYTISYAVRQAAILEFAPTLIALILIGKVGSSIASEIGTMRVTEQIDALEIMGINSGNFLVQPKVLACLLINPFLVVLSMGVIMIGGYLASVVGDLMSSTQFVYGLQFDFKVFDFYYAMIKTVVFAFIISSIPSYYGYYAYGGSREVAHASTTAVVTSSVVMLVANYLLTDLLLL